MTLKKSEKRLLVFLGIVVVVFFFDRFVGLPVGKKAETDKESLKTQAAKTVFPKSMLSGNLSRPNSDSMRRRFESWGRDPFSGSSSTSTVRGATASSGKGGKSKPELRGIFWKQGKPYVLINDIILSEGEEKNGLRVERVEGTEVLCSQGSRSFTLHWRESP